MRSRTIIVALAAIAMSSIATPAMADRAEEEEMVLLVNGARSAEALPPLSLEPGLVDDARRHTAEMIEAGDVFQSSSAQLAGYATGWELLGENVGYGPDSRMVHDAFMQSGSHRENILGDFDTIAIGAERAGDGTLFVTVIFMKRAADAGEDLPTVPTSIRSVAMFPAMALERIQALALTRVETGPDREACGLSTATGLACID